MGKEVSVLLVTLTCVTLLLAGHSQGEVRVNECKGGTLKTYCYCCSLTGSLTVAIDSYTHNSTLTSGDSVPLGNQIFLVCRVVGQPYGTPLSYTWTCPNGSCEVEGYYGRKVHNEHILAVNITSTSDGGTYTCQVTATGGQEATGSFALTVTGK